MNELKDLLDQMLLAVAIGKHRRPDQELTAFFPVTGSVATGELMVVGRAVNGWSDGWRPQQALDPQVRQKIIANICSPPWAANQCPMSWIQRDWGATGFVCLECRTRHSEKVRCTQCGKEAVHKAYNTAKSAFYRVMRSATEALTVADTNKPDWPSHLIWTDLYKVAPAIGGNPSSGLIKLQHNLCVKMLAQEIQQHKPRRVLFLTGLYWAEPFLPGIGVTSGRRFDGLVSYAGRIEVSQRLTSLVVAPHPQGKSESQIVTEIDKAFSELESKR